MLTGTRRGLRRKASMETPNRKSSMETELVDLISDAESESVMDHKIVALERVELEDEPNLVPTLQRHSGRRSGSDTSSTTHESSSYSSKTLLSPDLVGIGPQQEPIPLWYACSKCYQAFKLITDLRVHLLEKHGIQYQERVEHPGSNSFLTVGKKSVELNLGPNLRERQLSVLQSKIHGKGLFSGGFIPEGEIIIEYTGEIINRTCALRRQHYYDAHKLDHYIMKVGKTIIDATVNGNCSKFINNSCDPNCLASQVDLLGKSRVLIMSARKILAGEELTYDYQFTSDELIPCNCGATNCRRFINANLEKLKLGEQEIEGLIKSLTD